jgi:hypothetical protein
LQNIPALKDGAPLDAAVGVSPKGWTSSELLLKKLEQFMRSLPPARPVLFLVDSHASSLSPDLLMAGENQIIILTFPSHTTYLLQPLDHGWANFFVGGPNKKK